MTTASTISEYAARLRQFMARLWADQSLFDPWSGGGEFNPDSDSATRPERGYPSHEPADREPSRLAAGGPPDDPGNLRACPSIRTAATGDRSRSGKAVHGFQARKMFSENSHPQPVEPIRTGQGFAPLSAFQPAAGEDTRAPGGLSTSEFEFTALALDLFALQYRHNAVYHRLCAARGVTPDSVSHWRDIPAVPTGAFKEFELTSLPSGDRTTVFHSSGTTGQQPSRHIHSAESLALYEASLVPWFAAHLLADMPWPPEGQATGAGPELLMLTPNPSLAPHSSLVHMFATVRRRFGNPRSMFCGTVVADGAWSVDLTRMKEALEACVPAGRPVVLLGTAFNFVHLLDHLAQRRICHKLPAGSRVMETGGYKGRSRSMPRAELHALMTELLGILPENIVCEYGMSELSSQAYDSTIERPRITPRASRVFRFPPWARARIVSPETGREVAEGETGLIQVFDLASAWSVLAIQTEDLGVRRGSGFELLGRATAAEPRGCSLMTL